MDPIAEIAQGRNPTWEATFKHPAHGDLLFRVPGTLTNREWMAHAVRTDEIIIEAGGNPDQASNSTKTFAASLAGIQVVFAPIVIDEDRVEDPESGHEQIVKKFYDPQADDSMDIAIEAWLTFMSWRSGLLDRGAELGKDSGETSGKGSDESSPVATASPSMIPA
jgi:hypothetical protein